MNFASVQTERDLVARIQAGDIAALDQLGAILYGQGKHELAAESYMKAYLAGYYKHNNRPQSEAQFFGMIDRGLVPATSDAARLVRQIRQQGEEVVGRARAAAGKAGIATFIGYMIIAFGFTSSGFLRDYSLVVGGALAWLVWYMILATFEK